MSPQKSAASREFSRPSSTLPPPDRSGLPGKSSPLMDRFAQFSMVGVYETRKGLKFVHISSEKLEGQYTVLIFMDDRLTDLEAREWKQFSDEMEQFREAGAQVMGVCTDSHVTIRTMLMNSEELQGIQFPIISDRDGDFSRAFGVLKLHEGRFGAARAVAILSPSQQLVHLSLHNERTRARPADTLSLIKRLQDAPSSPALSSKTPSSKTCTVLSSKAPQAVLATSSPANAISSSTPWTTNLMVAGSSLGPSTITKNISTTLPHKTASASPKKTQKTPSTNPNKTVTPTTVPKKTPTTVEESMKTPNPAQKKTGAPPSVHRPSSMPPSSTITKNPPSITVGEYIKNPSAANTMKTPSSTPPGPPPPSIHRPSSMPSSTGPNKTPSLPTAPDKTAISPSNAAAPNNALSMGPNKSNATPSHSPPPAPPSPVYSDTISTTSSAPACCLSCLPCFNKKNKKDKVSVQPHSQPRDMVDTPDKPPKTTAAPSAPNKTNLKTGAPNSTAQKNTPPQTTTISSVSTAPAAINETNTDTGAPKSSAQKKKSTKTPGLGSAASTPNKGISIIGASATWKDKSPKTRALSSAAPAPAPASHPPANA